MLNTTQLQALKADIIANHSAEWAAGQVNLIAEAYNATASGPFVVWRTAITGDQVRASVDWAEVIALTQGQRDTFRFLVESNINASDPNIRAAFVAVFAAGTTRTNLIALSKRAASVVEAMFATGTGSDANPATLTHEGAISGSIVVAAMGS